MSVADHVDPLVYSPNIKDRFGEVDCVLGAGDLDVIYYEYIVTHLNKPLFFVFGNHNLSSLPRFRQNRDAGSNSFQAIPQGFGSKCIDGSVHFEKKSNLIVAGLGGCRRYNSGYHQFTELQMFLRIATLFPPMLLNRVFRGRWLDILLTHAAPAGIHDRVDACHRGFKVFLWFMRSFKPRYLIHGHVHLYDINGKRSTRYSDTIVINAYDHIVFNLENEMMDNSYVEYKADSDFSRAKQRAWIESLKNFVNPEAGQLLSFHDIKNVLKPESERYLSMKTVSIDKIVGSEDRYMDFSRHFFPKKEHLRQRWKNIDKAHLTDVILPPIKLLKIGELYFVRDGNHRVSVALSQGMKNIDAEVIELGAKISIKSTASREEIIEAVIEYERNSVLEQTGLARMIPVETINFTALGRWHELLNHIEGHKYFINMDDSNEIPFENAARSWFDNLYSPIIQIIQKEDILVRFPNRTEADLYIWMIKHWHCLKEKCDPKYPLNQAVSEFAATHGRSFSARLMKRMKKLFGYAK
ncbi:hypothetical protein S1OALGB6SA_618 [Olavius algarvensis spirochete endosymbiont]|uniref:metallophosphoesterase n=1 Tax=Olavius algarvensis spirochete endosymbiont TaxID=260710 RepID=UPI00068EE117|nr:metallophosphoesterase [Olavius algarvensis spirochete endosymbiont]VDA99549.1 hypothetical protein S1OALGB6SA_618 [Olavius algarvensis spirochete endosymbiont]